MTKTLTKKLSKLIASSTNQESAMMAFLSEGNTVTASGASAAGIGDPRRVVNRLRNSGIRINRDLVTGRGTSAIVYSLAPAKRKTRK
jgi:hypothetical protein